MCPAIPRPVPEPKLTEPRNFIPDSGKLLHLKTPVITDTVRIDAGFVAGDEISSHYDPMIAKLIVHGVDRRAALQKMHAALEAYEIAGPVTNIEFLKRMCVSPAFVAGDVETGYIEKHRDELFSKQEIEPEVWVQAALGMYTAEQALQGEPLPLSNSEQVIGFGTAVQARHFDLTEIGPDGKGSSAVVHVGVRQLGPLTFSVSLPDQAPMQVTSKFDPATNIVQSFLPHTRLETTFVRDPATNMLTLFQRGRQYRVQLAVPKWAEKALGLKDVTNSVLAPMPCKVLRVEVDEGAQVVKNQPLVVIESMKMETVIRAPHDGTIKKIVHKAGDLCKAGTALVEFADEAS